MPPLSRRAFLAQSSSCAAHLALAAALGDWAVFNLAFFERAFAAWYREWGVGGGA